MRKALLVVFIGLMAFATVAADTGDITRVSVRSNGDQANDVSFNPDVSADGRYTAFASDATNLVEGDTNGAMDIFVHDRDTGATSRVSRDSGGTQGNFDSFRPAISDDGRYVAFCSYATNLAPNDDNNVVDVFLHDRQTGSTFLVSKSIFGTSGNDVSCQYNVSLAQAYGPDISADGRYIVFESYASDLIGNDNNGYSDIFRYDRSSGSLIRVSVDSANFEANGSSESPSISADGNLVAFDSRAANLVSADGNGYSDVFVRNISTGQTRRVSVKSDGTEGNGDSFEPEISDDGQFVTFSSFANNLVSGDTNNYLDVFLHNRGNGQTERVSIASDGTQSNTFADIARPTVSGDGRFAAFQSYATSLVSGDPNPDAADIYVRDRQTGTLFRASATTSSTGNQSSGEPSLSADGFYVGYSSKATNLISGDTNGDRDIFLYQILEPPPPPPPPPPTLSVNYTSGAPGSYFQFNGALFQQNEVTLVYVNGHYLGTVNADLGGNLVFQVRSFAASQEGAYGVTVYGSEGSATAVFFLNTAAPTRPQTSGTTFSLPADSAYTNMMYLPIVANQ
ncbi:MAG: PD40 domain-containing protein [Ardenticatenaceae bacterium]|nr:PD40 domain-containing protein [Ardenticatenaceae bacterium]MCB8991162.1 PD40 domain-containing protein [Ardenticatenaceae bacterium]MCB9005370.1 PD40 domain-containing protein [Ardenticatenaceae bacterium]